MERFDVIIVGTGAGGGTLLSKLVKTNKRILVLERGDYVKREKENWIPSAVFLENRYTTEEQWLDASGAAFRPGMHYFVGGNTKFFGAALLRMRAQDFGELKHSGGVSPAWPIKYEDLQPYYLEAERLYSVHGQRGSDPCEPFEPEPYPFPAVSHEPRMQELVDGLTKAGCKPFYLPMGVRLNEQEPHKSECVRCDSCDGFPCLVNAKADADTTCVRPALQSSNVTLMTHTKALRFNTNETGTMVTSVVVDTPAGQMEFGADVFISSCGAVNSAALLLRSANDRHPNGLANGSDQVGRNYMCHNNSAVLAVSVDPNPTVFQKTLGLNDYYFSGPNWDFPMGHIQMIGKSQGDMLKGDAPKFTPGVALDEIAKHALDFWLTSEDLPDANNRVSVERDGQIRLAYKANNEEGHKRLVAQLEALGPHYGLKGGLLHQSAYLGKKIPVAGCAHQNGTCRMGTDPSTSVVDTNCKAHELDNLYVVDGSFFVSSSAVNPALTIMANALRVGDHLATML